jgi:hypothetical protein
MPGREEGMSMFVRKVLAPLVAASLAIVVFALPATAAGAKLTATLTGAAEAPGPGDANGSGVANVRVQPGKGRLCFDIQVSGIQLPATMAHIHEAPPGVAGPVVVTLAAPDADGTSSGCLSGLSRPLLRDIAQNPGDYYVNVHNEPFPAGAVRGQLASLT